jgi:hypothetical protein
MLPELGSKPRVYLKGVEREGYERTRDRRLHAALGLAGVLAVLATPFIERALNDGAPSCPRYDLPRSGSVLPEAHPAEE